MLNIIEQWLRNKIDNKEIGKYLSAIGINSVVIYGAGKIGELLYDDLLQSGIIDIECFIDKNASSLYYGIDDVNIYSLEEVDKVQKVDAIIITPYKAFTNIKEELKKRLSFETKYISFDDIIWKVE